jgi:ribulose-phosphate 3-epimerase
LGDQVAEAERAGADRIDVDVMDGHFVPNISMGTPIIGCSRRVTRQPLEAHLMIANPDSLLEEFTHAGVVSFLVHWEGNNVLSRTIRRIKALGKRVGAAVNPATSATVLEEVMQDVEQVLVMTVSPGFGHQQFLRSMLPKIRRARNMIGQMQLNCALEVDGGIDPTTAPLAVAAGADVLVAGSEIFDADEGIAAATQSLRAASTPGVMSCSWR